MTDKDEIPDSEAGSKEVISYEPDVPESDLPEEEETTSEASAEDDQAAQDDEDPAASKGAAKASDDKSDDDTDADSGDDAAAEPVKPKKPSGVQKRIDELTANWRSAERRAERLEEMLAGQIKQPAKQDTKPEAAEPPPAPKQDQFENYDEYLIAKAKFELGQEFRDKLERDIQAKFEAERSEREKSIQEIRASDTARQFQARVKEARSRYDDYDSVVTNSDVGVSDTMTQLILVSEKGPDIAYHLGHNPELAARILSLSPLEQAREMGRIEEIISRPPPRKSTAAPKPPKTVAKGNAGLDFDPEKSTFSDYVKWRSSGKAI